jgi:hypothetical protein
LTSLVSVWARYVDYHTGKSIIMITSVYDMRRCANMLKAYVSHSDVYPCVPSWVNSRLISFVHSTSFDFFCAFNKFYSICTPSFGFTSSQSLYTEITFTQTDMYFLRRWDLQLSCTNNVFFFACLQVEAWLNKLLDAMQSTIRHEMTEAVISYEEKPRDQWLFDPPAQVMRER